MRLQQHRTGFVAWVRSGDPWIWFTAAAVSISIAAVIGLLLLIGARGFGHFWPDSVALIRYQDNTGSTRTVLGEIAGRETLPIGQFLEADPSAAASVPADAVEVERWLVRSGNRREAPPDFRWVVAHQVEALSHPPDALVLERAEWGNAYGFLHSVHEGERPVASGSAALEELERRLARADELRERIHALEQGRLYDINYRLERLRLDRRALELTDADAAPDPAAMAELDAAEAELRADYRVAEAELRALRDQLGRDSIRLELADGRQVTIGLGEIVRVWQPNAMGTLDRVGHYFRSLWLFLSEPPREANTEGGVYPAIFGTVMMVLLMSLMVTPFGVIAAVYLREYARQGPFVRLIRIAVNNLAGVPSIVYGVFGLGFFVYFLGGSIDALFFAEALPSPTFGTPGLLWASLTLALLTVPVVIVSTEEGLTRIPRSLREGSLALGATKAETLFKVVLPVASPSILTGVILAVARAAGEVAPLMLVGVVKLAPALPVDGNFPYVHLERKFMHLGFHIYDVGFQSPNVEAARPLVFATALLLVVLIIVLNLTAIMLRNRLENRYRGVEG
ncbi:MAG TPA: phosphate ABC transporter permease PstA [Pseudomonadales bacterium]